MSEAVFLFIALAGLQVSGAPVAPSSIGDSSEYATRKCYGNAVYDPYSDVAKYINIGEYGLVEKYRTH